METPEILLETGATARELRVCAEYVRVLQRKDQLKLFAMTSSGRRLFRAADVEALRLRRAARDKARA
jgi:hypothetical protein